MVSDKKNSQLKEEIDSAVMSDKRDATTEEMSGDEKKTKSKRTVKAADNASGVKTIKADAAAEEAVPVSPVDTDGAENIKELLQVNAVSGLNCRSKGGMDAEVIVCFVNSTVVTVLDKSDPDWYQISIGDYEGKSYEGYCNSKYLGPVKI